MDSSSRHRRRHCPHCNEYLSYSAYRSHKSLYYITSEQRWVANLPSEGQPSVAAGNDLEDPNDIISFERGIRSECMHTTSTHVLTPICFIKNQVHQSPLVWMMLILILQNVLTVMMMQVRTIQLYSKLHMTTCIIDSNLELVDIIVEDSDEENEIAFSTSSPINKILGITVAFLLNLRVLHNLSEQAVKLLLRFFKYIFLLIGTAFGIPELKQNIHLPQSIQGCYSFMNVDSNPCKEYIVCPGCNVLYDQSVKSLTQGTSSNPESARCSFTEFPNHPQRRFRQPCNTILLQKVQRKKKNEFRPRKIYYYFGLKRALLVLLSRPNFLNMCNAWHVNKNPTNFLADITDGKIWNEIISMLTNGQPNNILGILINIDWFQPYKHVSYSVGVIYAVIINLPRSYRYKTENVLIIGIIPGPCEPKLHVNSFLGPLVSELLELQTGQWFSTPVGNQFVKCVIVGLSSDIPATRKAAGFV